jgi:hypothetical protein
MAQAVECLLCKCEALRSNPSPIEKKKKRENLVIIQIHPQHREEQMERKQTMKSF